MANLPRVISIKVKIERAREHVDALKSEIDAFWKDEPYVVVPEEEQQTGDRVFRVRIQRELPRRWAAIAGDVVHNLRSALDHLAWQLVEANGNTPDHRTEFPIGRDANDFNSRCLKKVKGASDPAVRLVASLEPYKGGDERFFALHTLDIVDKHRLLITVGAARDSVIHGPEAIKIVEVRLGGPDGPIVPLPFEPEYVRFHFAALHKAFPLKDGAEIYRIERALRDRPNVDMNPQFHFEAAFGETGVFEGEPIVPILVQLANLIDSTIDIFFGSLTELK